MKKIFRRLVCCLFFIGACIGCFDTEARLPKYMAQRAAELLIEKSGLQLKEGVTKEGFAANLVDFLYSTEKRQHLANWMKRRLPFKVHGTPVAWKEDENDFKNLLDAVDEAFNDTEDFRTFVNQHFPCWTGTLTCFILNGEAHKLLAKGNVVDSCRIKLNSAESTRKIVSILFVLELIDNWSDIKQICKAEEEADDDERLKVPDYNELDPYDCVPVPNTAYEYEGIFKGTCLLSAIRNLLSILGCSYQDFMSFNIKHGIKEYLCSHHLATIPGITNINEQNRWAGPTCY